MLFPSQGTLFFQETETFTDLLDACMFVFGVSITLVGVAALSIKEGRLALAEKEKELTTHEEPQSAPLPQSGDSQQDSQQAV
jgi:hypothetical protein